MRYLIAGMIAATPRRDPCHRKADATSAAAEPERIIGTWAFRGHHYFSLRCRPDGCVGHVEGWQWGTWTHAGQNVYVLRPLRGTESFVFRLTPGPDFAWRTAVCEYKKHAAARTVEWVAARRD